MKFLACSTIAALLISGCAETPTEASDTPSPHEESAFVALVSDPGPGAASTSRGRLSPNTGVVDPFVWIALPPASVPGGVEAAAVNLRTGVSTSTLVIDGGFDPIPLPAAEGDTLRVVVSLSNGGAASARMVVPARRRPRVVRTRPAAGRVDVAINSSVVVVFSEPIAPASVDPANVRLLRGSVAVPGTVRFVEGSPTSIQFVPETPLEAGAAYQLVIGQGVVDLSGDPMETELTVPFSTRAAEEPSAPTTEVTPYPGELGLLAISVNGIVVYEPGGTYFDRLSDVFQARPNDPFTHDFFPAWSRDGNRIAFSRVTGESSPLNGAVSHIHVMNADGSGEVTITPLDGFAMRPTWSPDGSRIAFETRRNPQGQDEIYVMNADGSNPVRLTNTPQPSWGAAWSPDGTKIAYVSYDATGNGGSDIFVMNPDGSGAVNLTKDIEFDNHPDWSPDGSRIAFTKGSHLYVMNADGSNPSRVDLSGGPAIWAAEPKWAPDGLSILYATSVWCDWGDQTCVDYTGPSATVVRLSDGFQWALPASREGSSTGHWSWRPR